MSKTNFWEFFFTLELTNDPQIMKKFILFLVLTHLGYGQTHFNQGKTASPIYSTDIPIEFINQKIIIPVKIEGKMYRFIVDTGAPNSISQKLFNELNPEIIDEIVMRDANNFENTQKLALIKKLEIGTILFENSPVLVNKDDENIFYKCWEIDGFIGSNLLRNSVIQFNLANNTIILANDIKQLCMEDTKPTKIVFFDNQSSPFIWVNLAEKGPKQQDFVLIDTGMYGIYDMSLHSYNRLKEKIEIDLLNTSDGASIIGSFEKPLQSKQHRLQIPHMKVGDFTPKNTVTITTPSDFSRIGAELLNHGIMTIDYVNEGFYFNPNSETKEFNFNEPLLGFSRTLMNNKSVVGYVWDESLKNKLHYGDEIIEINGTNISNLSPCEFLMKKTYPKGQKPFNMIFKSSDGVPFSLKIKFDSIKK